MAIYLQFWIVVMIFACLGIAQRICEAQSVAPLPEGVRAVWDIDKAYTEATSTCERVCINGLWQWQPAEDIDSEIPSESWGYLKVPGTWPETAGGYMWRESQAHYPHPGWESESLHRANMAWYQREITIPREWAGRRITVYTEYLNSYAVVYVDGSRMGEIHFPGGEVDITSACQPGSKHTLSLFVAALPLHAEITSYANTNEARRVRGRVTLRGLCGDVFLTSTPAEERISDVKVDTSVRKWEITFDTALQGLKPDSTYILAAQVVENGREVANFRSKPFKSADLEKERLAFTNQWKPPKLWDIHTPQNTYELHLSLLDSDGQILDAFQPLRFGFREFWIDGRDFRLNGTRFFCFVVPLDNAMVSAASATYEGARESFTRLKAVGVNTMYTHNYGCQPGSHLSFAEILRAADDVGMLIVVSQPHFSHYEWDAGDADDANGYARHAEFYVRMAQNHPSVVMYSMNHNSLSYEGAYNPDLMDGLHNEKGQIGPRTDRGARRGERTEAIVKRFDSTRVIYHHSSGNLGQMHTNNLYLDFVPIQERSDWFEHWSTEGVKPLYLCEYGAPWGMNWTLYRGWYEGVRDFGSAAVPWEFCAAEWNSQFLGDRAFKSNEMERESLRFEAKQWRAGKIWHRWDYPFQVIGSYSLGYDDKEDVWAMYITDNWRAFRTWGLSGFNVWGYGVFWKLRDGADKGRKMLEVDWDNLQKPGYSPDFIGRQYERVDMGYDRSDWIPTTAAKAILRNNQPLLAYIAGKPGQFTSKDHNFQPGETVEKQIIIINNSREMVNCDCSWSLALPQAMSGNREISVATGEQGRIPLQFELPDTLSPGKYELTMTVRFSSGETQDDSFAIHVLPRQDASLPEMKIALYDPRGETAKWLGDMGILYEQVRADSDLAGYDVLIVGKGALTVDGAAPDIGSVRDGLKVLMFEQTANVLEKRFGFRVQEYGLRRVFKRVPDHPVLAGLDTENLRDWRGEATIMPPRLEGYELLPRYGPTIEWCGIRVPRAWRAGCRGNVASVLIEKPTNGDFVPIIDGGFSLQYSPLMEYREGEGMILLCQMDVTGRTEIDPAATLLVANMLKYISEYVSLPHRTVVYAGDPAGKSHLDQAGVSLDEYKGDELTPDQVLVVGTGGSAQLAANKDAIARWLNEGGNVVAIGLDEQEVRSFLPFNVNISKSEHINSYFEPAGMKSLLAGIGPADVHNRDPREIGLATGGANVTGNGVLAVAEDASVAFCQLAPWEFNYETQYNLKRTFRRTSFLLTRLLGNMGSRSATPLLSRFSTPVSAAADVPLVLTGLYMDKPVEMDDPYRFFCW